MEPNTRRRALRTAIWALVALAALALGAYLFLKANDGLSGGSLVAERSNDALPGLALNESRTRADLPALAQLLDKAVRDGSATSSDARLRSDAMDYLERRATEAGARSFREAPANGMVVWQGQKLSVYAPVK